MMQTTERLITLLICLALACACGGKDGTEGDADTGADTQVDTAADTTDPPPDTPPDTAGDPDAVEDTAGDTAADPGEEDTAGDTGEDTAADPADDDAADVIDEDAAAEVTDITDITSETTCTGTPHIRRSAKGTEYTTGGCNPDGSTTEALVATDLGGCCIRVDHYCAWMNCCSTLSPVLSPVTTARTVSITENETGAMCSCEGWFSPVYEVCGLAPGTWTVQIGTLTTTVVVT